MSTPAEILTEVQQRVDWCRSVLQAAGGLSVPPLAQADAAPTAELGQRLLAAQSSGTEGLRRALSEVALQGIEEVAPLLPQLRAAVLPPQT